MIYPPPADPEPGRRSAGRNEAAVAAAARRYGYERAYTDWREMLKDDRRAGLRQRRPEQPARRADASPPPRPASTSSARSRLARTADEAKRCSTPCTQAGVKHMVRLQLPLRARRPPGPRADRAGRCSGEIYHFRARYLQEWIADPDFPHGLAAEQGRRPAGARSATSARTSSTSPASWSASRRRSSALTKTFITERPRRRRAARARSTWTTPSWRWSSSRTARSARWRLALRRRAQEHQHLRDQRLERADRLQPGALERAGGLLVDDRAARRRRASTTCWSRESFHPFWENWWPQGHIIGWEHTFVHEFAHFLDAIVNDKRRRPYGATFEDGYRNAVICDAIVRSAREGRRVEIAYE